MSVQHSVLTSTDLHECKGASTASLNTVRVSDGAGSGTWQKITTSQLDATSIFNSNERNITIEFPDVSTALVKYVPIPWGCTLTAAYTTLGAAITIANSIITVKDNGGNTAGTITVAFSGSAAGDVDTTTFAVNNTFTAGQRLSVETDGGSTTTATLTVTLVFTRTA